jgi:broad specificity phosphatase PhoE
MRLNDVPWATRLALRGWRLRLATPRSSRRFTKRLMDTLDDVRHAQGARAQTPAPAKPPRMLLLIRHGQTTYNVEGRLPGQLEGVALTDEGRRQAQRAAVALSNLPLSAVVASPLERARETGEILARGWSAPVTLDARLKDTDIGPWAGMLINDLNKTEPSWKEFVEKPSEPPEGVEGFLSVQERAVAAVKDVLGDATLGNYVAVVAHADVVKLILAYYTETPVDVARFTAIANASISALLFGDEPKPQILAVNWQPFPGWLAPFALPKPGEQQPGGATEAGGATEPPSAEGSSAAKGAETGEAR